MTSPWAFRKIVETQQHTRHLCSHVSSHNLRMHPRLKLTNPYTANLSAFGAALHSNKVYLPRLSSLLWLDFSARQINAIRYTL